jgi:hypothetical protein
MNKEWLAWLVFGLCVAALGLAHYWGLKRRAASMKKFAEEHGMSYADWSPTPSSFPHSGNELKNAISGNLNGHKVFIVDEHVSGGKSPHIRTVVGFQNYSPAYREWYDALRLLAGLSRRWLDMGLPQMVVRSGEDSAAFRREGMEKSFGAVGLVELLAFGLGKQRCRDRRQPKTRSTQIERAAQSVVFTDQPNDEWRYRA